MKAANLHLSIHFAKSGGSLVEEVVYNALAELVFLFILVHFEDLHKGSGINRARPVHLRKLNMSNQVST